MTTTPADAQAEHEHHWICLAQYQGPDATYGCQQCPATATGRDIGVTGPARNEQAAEESRRYFLDELAGHLANLIQAGVTEDEVRADFEAQMSLQMWTDTSPAQEAKQ